MNDRIVVTQATDTWIGDLPVEIVERKGVGHPDSLCDGIAESISRNYMRWCDEQLGAPLHHNFDKVQLVAGAVAVGFGGGEMLRPIRVQIAGRGTATTSDGRRVPLDILAIEAARSYLQETIRHLNVNAHVVVDCYAGQGAPELVRAVQDVAANDTSFGVAHWPLSPLEETVYETVQFLNHRLLKRLPIGEDVKVMGARVKHDIHLICAVPFLAQQVHSLAQYRSLKAEAREDIASYAATIAGRPLAVDVNAADREEEQSIYMTLTGTSAECGDDGATGRGNRVTGLITPYRPTSLEAVAGKNPISHVGKLYNVLALQAAREIACEIPDVQEAHVILLSQIGRPLRDPLVAQVNVRCKKGALTPGMRAGAAAILRRRLDDMDHLRREIVRGEIALF